MNINSSAGALHLESVAAEVVTRGTQMGIALEGDADRLFVVDEEGAIGDGDVVMAMSAAAKRDV